MKYECIIIGGGASGLMAASALKLNKRGIILEGTNRLGTKLLMSGGGHCNITHDGSIKEFVGAYGENGKKVRKLLYRHSNEELINLLESEGVAVKSDEDGRVFPASMKSQDILDVFVRRAKRNGWEIRTSAKVCSIKPGDDEIVIKLASGDELTCSRVILAGGGITYPGTGSDGSLHEIVKRDLGIEVTSLVPALRPVEVEGYPYAELAGLSIPRVKVTVKRHGKKDASWTGDMLLAHREFTGPVMLAASRASEAGAEILINYTAGNDIERFERALETIRSAMKRSGKALHTIAAEELGIPKRLASALAERAGSPEKLAKLVTEDSFKVSDAKADLRKAMVTRGGIPLDKECGADPKTLELAGVPGCYAIGELLDVDGATGGYNLQFAYSSACAAADHIGGQM